MWRAELSPSLRAGHVLQVYFYSVRQWPNTSEAREKSTFEPVTGPLLFFFTRSRFSPFGIKVISRRRSRFPQKKAIRVVVPTAAFVARETREMPKERGRSGKWLFPPPPRPPRCRGDPCTGRSQSRSWGKKVSNLFHQRNNCGFPIKNALASESGLVQQSRSGWWWDIFHTRIRSRRTWPPALGPSGCGRKSSCGDRQLVQIIFIIYFFHFPPVKILYICDAIFSR